MAIKHFSLFNIKIVNLLRNLNNQEIALHLTKALKLNEPRCATNKTYILSMI